MSDRENLHVLLLGQPGKGKSTLAATFPKPMLVHAFDPPGKDMPYWARGTVGPYTKGKFCYFRDVMSLAEPTKLIIRIKYFGEPNPQNPTAYQRYIADTASLESEIEADGYKTVVLDTATYFEYAARTYSSEKLNKGVKDGRQHYAFSTNAAEQFIAMRFPNLLMVNSLVLAHVDEQSDQNDAGQAVSRKMAALPGKLPGRLPGGFGEVWRVYYAGQDKDGRAIHLVQTRQRSDNTYDCKSLAGFPDPAFPDYLAMWEGLDKAKEAK